MKKYDKNRLIEVMSRLDKTFKPKLNEEINPMGTEDSYDRIINEFPGHAKYVNPVDSPQYKWYLRALNFIQGNNDINQKAELVKFFQNNFFGIDYGEFKTPEELVAWWLSPEEQKFIKDEMNADGKNVEGNDTIQEGRGELKRMTIFLMYDKNGSYLGDLDPIDEQERASEFYENSKSEVLATPEFQKFAQEKNITPDQIGRVKRDTEYSLDGNPLSFEYYAPSDSQELYDSKHRVFYNRSGQQLRNPEEYDRTNPEWTPFGDEGDY
jgi:hypothetical protein